jgi:hypothetical protein
LLQAAPWFGPPCQFLSLVSQALISCDHNLIEMNLLTFVRAMCLEVLDCGLWLLEFFVRVDGHMI